MKDIKKLTKEKIISKHNATLKDLDTCKKALEIANENLLEGNVELKDSRDLCKRLQSQYKKNQKRNHTSAGQSAAKTKEHYEKIIAKIKKELEDKTIQNIEDLMRQLKNKNSGRVEFIKRVINVLLKGLE